MSGKLTTKPQKPAPSPTFCHDCGRTVQSDQAAWADDGTPFCHPCLAAINKEPSDGQ